MVSLLLFLLWVRITCPAWRKPHELHLGSKSAYRNVANHNSSEIKYDSCRAVKLWALIRHGTRHPGFPLIQKIRTRLVAIRDLVLELVRNETIEIKNVESLESWTPEFSEGEGKKLTSEGEDEMFFLGQRLRTRFPKLLRPVYSSSMYHFKHTRSERTEKSAEAFVNGIFGRGADKYVEFPDTPEFDPILRFYKLCDRWMKNVKKHPDAQIEYAKFRSGNETAETVKAVNERLGLGSYLSVNDVHLMYMTCAFETANNKKTISPWCSVFTVNDLMVMEYAEDLKHYWIDGYGYELSYKQACKARDDLIEFFTSKETFPQAKIYFTHSGTLLKMLAHLGLYNQSRHLLADDFSRNVDRTWRVSRIDPFGTNLIFVLFKCHDEQKILTLHQEKAVRLPCCMSSDLCSLKQFLDYYSFKCLFKKICRIP